MSELRKGLGAMLAACTIWGLSSIYYKQLSHIPPIEILAHRTLWSLLFLCAVLVLGEPFTPLHAVVFALIWAAVAVYSLSALSRERATRRAAVSAGTSGMV